MRYRLVTCDPSAALTVFNSGASAETSTVWVTLPTWRLKSMSVWSPTRKMMFFRTTVLNPCDSTAAV